MTLQVDKPKKQQNSKDNTDLLDKVRKSIAKRKPTNA